MVQGMTGIIWAQVLTTILLPYTHTRTHMDTHEHTVFPVARWESQSKCLPKSDACGWVTTFSSVKQLGQDRHPAVASTVKQLLTGVCI